MNPVRIWKNIGFCLGFKSGVFWFRTNRTVYRALAPWNEPLFSERYIDKPKSYFGWRFIARKLDPVPEQMTDAIFDVPVPETPFMVAVRRETERRRAALENQKGESG